MKHKPLSRIALAISVAMLFSACTALESPVSKRKVMSPTKTVEKKTPRARPAEEAESAASDSVNITRNDSRRHLRSAARQQPVPATMMEHELLAPGHGVPPGIRPPGEPVDRENYAHFTDNPVKLVTEHPVSTFSVDVDTGAYANVRRFLNSGRLPRHDAVRVEEMINYFDYDYPLPASRKQPFHVTTEIAPAPWNGNHHLLHIGIKGYDLPAANLPPANLVFLVDVSGSMRSADKLDLLKSSIKLLAERMHKCDRITLVVYAGASGVVLPAFAWPMPWLSRPISKAASTG